jgi:hypothetical protein
VFERRTEDGFSKATGKEGTGTGSKKEGRMAYIVKVAFFNGMAPFNF